LGSYGEAGQKHDRQDWDEPGGNLKKAYVIGIQNVELGGTVRYDGPAKVPGCGPGPHEFLHVVQVLMKENVMKCQSRVAKLAGGLVLVVLLAGLAGSAVKDKYSVHDKTRPNPPVVTPGAQLGQPPSDATILFDGKDLSQWRGDKGGPAAWRIVDNDHMVVPPKAGGIRTQKAFGSCQLHIEWRTPEGIPPAVTDQKRSNSGVFFMGRYEVQILDSYTDDNYQTNKTYADGQAAAIYGSHPPLVNATRKAGEWQTYDIAFLRPVFDDAGAVVRKARITVFHNGVCVHNNLEIEGTTSHKRKAAYTPHGEGPISLQDHGNPMAFRNIWIRELPEQPYLIE
jgi:hypothetical protein